VTTAEVFTRLYYYGKVQMRLTDDEFWTMPFGLFMDLWACHKQFLGIEKVRREQTIDDVAPI
jgi:hypothetical protein